jgi:hypothetical protein
MVEEKPQFELIRLRKEQNKARHDEVFGGMSPAERAAYNRKSGRIHELQIDFQVNAFTKKSLWSAKSEAEPPVELKIPKQHVTKAINAVSIVVRHFL